MSKKNISIGKSYRRTIVAVILLVVVHYALLRWMDGSNAFAVLTASGQNAPMLTTLGAMTLVGLRMYLYLVVPGMAIARGTRPYAGMPIDFVNVMKPELRHRRLDRSTVR